MAIGAQQDQKKNKIVMEKPDFEKIKKETYDPKSKYYYPKLMTEYLGNDTNMTMTDFRYLYYGYLFQEDYDPYRTSEFPDKIEKLYYKSKNNLTKAEKDTIEKYAKYALADNPFDLRQLTFLVIAFKEKEKNNIAKIREYKFRHLLGAILSSGNGTEEHPWYVITPNHEYNLLNFMDLVVTDHKSLDNSIDYLTVKKKNSKSPDGYYFDVSKMIEMYKKKF